MRKAKDCSTEDLAELVLERALRSTAGRKTGCVALAVTGLDCAGKSSLALQLLAICEERGVPTAQVSMDDFFIPPARRPGGVDPGEEYYEHALDYPAFSRAVTTAMAQLGRSLPGTGRAGTTTRSLLVAEGVFLLRSDLQSLWDYSVWLEIDRKAMIRRAMVRDSDYFGSPLAAARAYVRRCIPAQRTHLTNDCPLKWADLAARFGERGWEVRVGQARDRPMRENHEARRAQRNHDYQ